MRALSVFSLAIVSGFLTVSAPAATIPDLDSILPRLAATGIEERHQAQVDLEALTRQASRPDAEKDREALAKSMASKAGDASVPQPTRVSLIRQLELIGGKESVPTLETLLGCPDPELAETARRALERNTSSAADQALLRALKASPNAGVQRALIRSLGQRRTKDAVPAIVPRLEDEAAAAVAAEALGMIATRPALEALWKARDAGRAAANDGLLVAGAELLTRGDMAGARKIGDALHQSGNLPVVRAQALMLLARTGENRSNPLVTHLASDLNDPSPQVRRAAVDAARAACGPRFQAFLTNTYPSLRPESRIMVLDAFDATAESLVAAEAGTATDETIRLAALAALSRIGGPASVPVLLEAATTPAGPIASAAQRALRTAPGNGVETEMLKLTGQISPDQRAAALRALGERYYEAAIPIFIRYAATPASLGTNEPSASDLKVADAAFAALGRLGGDAELEPMLPLALKTRSSAAEPALQSVVSRCRNKPIAVQKLSGQISSASPEKVPLLVDNLAQIDSREATIALVRAARSNKEPVRDAAVRALAASPLTTNIPAILEIASSPSVKKTHNILLIQGLIRLLPLCEQPDPARIRLALDGMRAAQRVDEQKGLLAVLAGISDPAAAQAITPYLKDAILKEDATRAAVVLAESLKKGNPAAAKALAKAAREAGVPEDLSRRLDEILK